MKKSMEILVPMSCLIAVDVRQSVLHQAKTRDEFAKMPDEEIISILRDRFDAHVRKTGDPSCHPSSVGYLGECLHFGYADPWLGTRVRICEPMLSNPHRKLYSTVQYPPPTGQIYRVTARTTEKRTGLYGDAELVRITPEPE